MYFFLAYFPKKLYLCAQIVRVKLNYTNNYIIKLTNCLTKIKLS
jgi:hypothetical protein